MIRLLEAAELELDEARDYYNTLSPNLGDAFILEVVSALERIEHYPNAWQELTSEIRRYRLPRFPYGIIYAHEDGDILVLAVAHLHRQPEYWMDRIKK
ncbi:MAG: type II toxin-antitoxin system RelE/ParE family toxin [Pseudomonadota bacterium]